MINFARFSPRERKLNFRHCSPFRKKCRQNPFSEKSPFSVVPVHGRAHFRNSCNTVAHVPSREQSAPRNALCPLLRSSAFRASFAGGLLLHPLPLRRTRPGVAARPAKTGRVARIGGASACGPPGRDPAAAELVSDGASRSSRAAMSGVPTSSAVLGARSMLLFRAMSAVAWSTSLRSGVRRAVVRAREGPSRGAGRTSGERAAQASEGSGESEGSIDRGARTREGRGTAPGDQGITIARRCTGGAEARPVRRESADVSTCGRGRNSACFASRYVVSRGRER